eukprot:GHVQ01002834.1.p1 GENE.GHVQ01002834.1~~GHVQ01002834.1.p1  ORF type:complete len:350 (-),score=17.98 GHVQ01002834.1:3754-4803(-)
MILEVTLFVLLALVPGWGCRALWQFYKLNFGKLSPSEREEFSPFERTDIERVTAYKALFGIFFVLPWRFLLFVVILAYNVIFFRLLTIVFPSVSDADKPGSPLSRLVCRVGGRPGFRMALWCFGVSEIREHDLGGIQHNSCNPICIVSNHVSNLDILYFIWRVFPSFVAKASIGTNVLLGPIARVLMCIFVDRESSVGRSRAYEQIRERQVVLKAGGEFPPFLVFPEGTTSNGRSLLGFKKGAFASLVEVTPVVLIYRCSFVEASYEITPTSWWLALLLSSVGKITLDAYWLPPMCAPVLDGDSGRTAESDVFLEQKYRYSVSVRLINVVPYVIRVLLLQRCEGPWKIL